MTTAAGQPDQLISAAVELVIANGGHVQTNRVHHLDRRLVVEQA